MTTKRAVRTLLRILTAAVAAVLPGVPSVLRRPLTAGRCLLFVLGMTALLNLVIAGLMLSISIATFDPLQRLGTTSLGEFWPGSIRGIDPDTTTIQLVAEVHSDRVSVERLRPIWSPGGLHTTRPYFWLFFVGFVLLYLVCGGLSMRDILREDSTP